MASRQTRFQALIWIFISTVVVSGGAVSAYAISLRWRANRPTNPHYLIRHIEQPSSSLPTDYLAELLDLSVDRPTNLYTLDLDAAHTRLLESPLIKSAKLLRHPPDTLTVDLEVREPIATLPEFSNTAIDTEGTLLPLAPFYLDAGLPKLILGITPHQPAPSCEATYHALNLLHLCSDVQLVDTSRLNQTSAGRREIIVQVQGHFLRLSPTHYEQALAHYRTLEPHLLPSALVDLRLKQLAYIATLD